MKCRKAIFGVLSVWTIALLTLCVIVLCAMCVCVQYVCVQYVCVICVCVQYVCDVCEQCVCVNVCVYNMCVQCVWTMCVCTMCVCTMPIQLHCCSCVVKCVLCLEMIFDQVTVFFHLDPSCWFLSFNFSWLLLFLWHYHHLLCFSSTVITCSQCPLQFWWRESSLPCTVLVKKTNLGCQKS